MDPERISIGGISAIVWGRPSEKVYLYVHGKMSCKEYAADFAAIAEEKGHQTISFDLPQHGERQNEECRCDIWNGMHDLKLVRDYTFGRWNGVSLYACSLGAYFSLQTYAGDDFRKCLFHSPIVDMTYLVKQMMLWFDVSEERLFEQQEIDTPIDPLRWDYYRYIQSHPVESWKVPTSILYGRKDVLQSRAVMGEFAERYGCTLTLAEDSAHAFMEEKDAEIIREWLREEI